MWMASRYLRREAWAARHIVWGRGLIAPWFASWRWGDTRETGGERANISRVQSRAFVSE